MFQSNDQFIFFNFKSPLLLTNEFFINKKSHSGTTREQKRVKEEEEEKEASDTVMLASGSARMTILKKAKVEQTTKLPKPHQHEQKLKKHGK
jgi:hypothetical protein